MLRLTDSETLDRGALSCALAGALCIAAGSAVATIAPHLPVAEWMRWTAPIFFGAAASKANWRSRLTGGVLGFGASLVGWSLASWPVFGASLAGGAIALLVARDATRRRISAGVPHAKELLAASVGAGALVWPLAVQAMQTIEQFVHVTSGPPVILETVAGGVLGLMMGMMSAPLHLAAGGNTVGETVRRLRPMLDGELRSLVLRIVDVREHALKLLDHSRANVDVRRDTRRGLDGVALTALELTERFSAVDQVLNRMPLTGIDERLEKIGQELASATDLAVRRDLERAQDALNEQRSQVERLVQSKQRLIARLQSELASLEKTEMALAVLISGDAAVAGLRLEALGSSLGRQAQELEAEGSALQEALLVSRPR